MLSERLRNKELFKDADVFEQRKRGLDLLDSQAEKLVIAMRTIENLELFDRETIEEYVIASIEASEVAYYGRNNEEFEAFLKKYLEV